MILKGKETSVMDLLLSLCLERSSRPPHKAESQREIMFSALEETACRLWNSQDGSDLGEGGGEYQEDRRRRNGKREGANCGSTSEALFKSMEHD